MAPKGIPVLRIDISKKSQRDVLEQLLSLDTILYVHFAPPCGTASAARHIKPGPPPLRSTVFPMGLPGLTFLQQTRVKKANFLYKWTWKLVKFLDSRNIGWSIENLASSLMWITDPFVEMVQQINFDAFSFHTCMFAAKRKKDTAIWTSVPQLRAYLERKCDNAHQHLPWGRTEKGFATAEECAYNDSLCASWAEAITAFALSRNFVAPPLTIADVQVETHSVTHVNKAILGCLPRGRKLVPLMSEFLQPQVHDISEISILQQLPLGKRIPDECTVFPKGSRLLQFVNEDGGNYCGTGMPTLATIGIPREPLEFLQEACKLIHPTEMAMQVGNLLMDNIKAYNDATGLKFRRTQCAFAKRLVAMCTDLKDKEAECKQRMEPHVRRILDGKRTVLFKQLLEEISYPDMKVATEMTCGFPLCGWLPTSDIFPVRVRAPEFDENFLRSMARSFSARSIAATVSSGDPELDMKLWQATLDEVEEGFLTGPWSISHLDRESVVSPRFGLQQKNKLRPIDNFTSSHVNNAAGVQERFMVDTVDEICAMVKAWMQESGPGLKLVGKTYDLRKAYRQLALRKAHLDFAWISVWDPVREAPALFKMETLPFGATASVSAFLRISQAIKVIGITHGNLVWSSFYDDFVCVCKAGTEEQTDRMVRLIFKSLGWSLSAGDEKDKPFASRFQALGVEFDLSTVEGGYFSVKNTDSRRAELSEKIDSILLQDELEPKVAESLRSRLLFAEGQLYGRFAKLALQRIGAIGFRSSLVKPLGCEVERALRWIKERILNAAPRRIDTGGRRTYYMFLDGACTDEQSGKWTGTSVGGVLADDTGKNLFYFGHVVDSNLVATWGPPDKTQHIFEAEVLPYALALTVWGSTVKGCCIFAFIDNEAAKASWITGSATADAAQRILHNGTRLEADLDVWPFFSRVPTHSNMGDDPSRGRFEMLEKLGAQRTLISDAQVLRLMADMDTSRTHE